MSTVAPEVATATMTTRFTVARDELVRAVDAVLIVRPSNLTAQENSAAFLFVARRGSDGTAACSIYSRRLSTMVARSTVPIGRLDQEGAFTFLARHVGIFHRLPEGGSVTFEAGIREAKEQHWVAFSSSSGAMYESATYDPALIARCDHDVESSTASGRVSSRLLAAGIHSVRPFLAEPKDRWASDAAAGVHAAPEGRLIAISGTQAATFGSSALGGIRFAAQREHLTPLVRFLAASDSSVSFQSTKINTYAINEQGDVLGWVDHHPPAPSVSDYPEDRDDAVLRLPAEAMIGRLRSAIGSLGRKASVRVEIDRKTLRIVSVRFVQSLEMPVPVIEHRGNTTELAFKVGLADLVKILEAAEGEEADLRVALVRVQQLDLAVLRTRETVQVRGRGAPQETTEVGTVTRYAIGFPVGANAEGTAGDRPAGAGGGGLR